MFKISTIHLNLSKHYGFSYSVSENLNRKKHFNLNCRTPDVSTCFNRENSIPDWTELFRKARDTLYNFASQDAA